MLDVNMAEPSFVAPMSQKLAPFGSNCVTDKKGADSVPACRCHCRTLNERVQCAILRIRVDTQRICSGYDPHSGPLFLCRVCGPIVGTEAQSSDRIRLLQPETLCYYQPIVCCRPSNRARQPWRMLMALHQQDLVPGSGDQLLTLDDTTGLQWLNLTTTANPVPSGRAC